MATSFQRNDFRSHSNPNMNCVEVAMDDTVAELRDSKTAWASDLDGRIQISRPAFAAFLGSLKR